MTIYNKIANVTNKIGVLSKELTNPFFKSKYLDINLLIENVLPLLKENNLLLLQPIENGMVKSVIIDTETGEKVCSEIKLPELPDPQKVGSAITYYRRYTLQSLLALQVEDDDANLASGYKKVNIPKNAEPKKAWLNMTDKNKNYTSEWLNVVEKIKNGTIKDVAFVRQHYAVSTEVAKEIENLLTVYKT